MNSINYNKAKKNFGFTDEQMHGHNWDDPLIYEATKDFLEKNQIKSFFNKFVSEKKLVSRNVKNLEKIRGLNYYQIKGMSLGLTKDQVLNFDWSDAGIAVDTIDFIENRSKNVSAIDALNQIRGLSLEEIRLKNLNLDSHYLNHFDLKDNQIYYNLKLIILKENKFTPNQTASRLIDLSANQLSVISSYNFNREDLSGHDWDNDLTKANSENFILEYKINNSSSGKSYDELNKEAYDLIKGLNSYEITAIKLGLTRENLRDIDWNNKIIAEETLIYLKSKPDNADINQIIDNVRGANEVEIQLINYATQSILKNGFSKEQAYQRLSIYDIAVLKDISEEMQKDFRKKAVLNILNSNSTFSNKSTDFNEYISNKISSHLNRNHTNILSRINIDNAEEFRNRTKEIRLIDVTRLDEHVPDKYNIRSR